MNLPSDGDGAERMNVDALRRQARRRRYRRVGLTLAAGFAVVLGVAAAVALTRGVRLIVSPTDAAASATVTLLDGVGFTLGERVYAFSSEIQLRVQAPGFFPADVLLAPRGASQYAEVELQERPATVTLSTSPVSEQTRWRVNDVIVGRGSVLELELAPGAYRISADSPFHDIADRSVSLARAEERTLEIPLRGVSGTMELASAPAGADVYVDGTLAGTTALTLPVTGGEYRLDVRRRGYADIAETVRITRGNPELRRDYRLQPHPGALSLQLSPAGGQLTIDGIEQRPASSPFQLAAGVPHTVVYSLAGFDTGVSNVTLAANETRALDIRLAPQIGEVRVEARPQAEVLVDGTPQGRTPLTLQLSAVEHRIRLEREGYAPLERALVPSPDAPRLISANLLTEDQAKSQAATRRYTNAAGIRMLRFDPVGGFMMGAPRAERGQRANEHLREVRLTRPFYVAQTETTRSQFARYRAGSGSGDTPVTGVSWEDAARFCNWLSEREGLPTVYQFSGPRYVGADLEADGYRLPTEAEWEWLARAAGRRQAVRFTWGNAYEVPERAGNFADETAAADSAVKGDLRFYLPRYTDGYARLAPVGRFAPHRSGLVDLAGNVSEWTHDVYALSPPAQGPTLDPAGPARENGEGHVVKGSSWRSGRVEQLRAAYRTAGTEPGDDLGFRVARYIY